MTMRLLLAILIAFAASGCGMLRSELALDDVSAVQTPIYSANKILFLRPTDDQRYGELRHGYMRDPVATQTSTSGAPPPQAQGTRRPVRNRQPLSIVVSRAYVPTTLPSCLPRATDALFGRRGGRRAGRDIAVLLDVSTVAERSDFIAVWYQRDVPPDETLTFQDLLVYSSDAWDAKYPPFFRMRLVDVSSERNTAVGALLDQVRSSSDTITGLLGVPGASPIIGIAALAARQVLAHDHNETLVDFTFQLYGEQVLSEAGGVPLGVLETGGILVTAVPCGAGNSFWNNDLKFDHRLGRIETTDGATQDMPYVFATILTADLAVPQIVRTRSAAIMRRLTDPQVVQTELQAALADAQRLEVALAALNIREAFRRNPTKEGFATMASEVEGQWTGLDLTERTFFLDSFYQITGRRMTDASGYVAWARACSSAASFDPNAARFLVDSTITGGDGQPCWPA